VLCAATEFAELPVRHNEDKLNVVLSQQVRWGVDARTAGGFAATRASAAAA
jgi:activating signal cointegrator complex subunit 3